MMHGFRQKKQRCGPITRIYGLLLFMTVTGCGGNSARETGQAPTGGTSSEVGKTTEVKEFRLVGTVRKVDQNARSVTIRHEEIPDFMVAMTMPFRLDDPELMDDLRIGDEVEGKLRVELENGVTKDYKLTDLYVTKPAPAEALVLDQSGSTPQLKVKPKPLEPGEEVPDFSLTGQDGQTFKLSDLRGKAVALTFIYTRCPLPDFCPMMDRKFADLTRSIEPFPDRAEKIRLISISFDPDHDTPEILRKHAEARGAKAPLWTFAVASHEELAKVASRFGLVYGPGKNEIIHNLCTAVVGPDGKLARLEVGTQSNKWSSADLLKTVYSCITTP